VPADLQVVNGRADILRQLLAEPGRCAQCTAVVAPRASLGFR
jgi:hypothetical protein